LFKQKYAYGVKRHKIHLGETAAELHWCTTVEFTQHSGDTTETYYRTDSKVPDYLRSFVLLCFVQRVCGCRTRFTMSTRGDGFKSGMRTFAGSHQHLVEGKKLGDPKLRR
jgi:hypothetical protein